MSITIRPHMSADLHALQDIAAKVFGHGYGTVDLFARKGNGIVVLKHNHKPIGFAVHRRMTDDGMGEIRKAGITLPQAIVLNHDRGWLEEIKTLAIAPAFQRQGLGGTLLDDVLGTLDRRGLSSIVPAWKVGGSAPIAPLLATRGFQMNGELRDIWKRECEAAAFECPARAGADACRCTAVIYTRIAI